MSTGSKSLASPEEVVRAYYADMSLRGALPKPLSACHLIPRSGSWERDTGHWAAAMTSRA